MLVLPDVNVLVAALHPSARNHHTYREWLDALVNSNDELAVIPATLVGTVRIVTNPRIFDPPAGLGVARDFVATIRGAPATRTLVANDEVWTRFDHLLADDVQARGNLVPDAWLAAVALAHGARLASADRGMARWPDLDWFDPAQP